MSSKTIDHKQCAVHAATSHLKLLLYGRPEIKVLQHRIGEPVLAMNHSHIFPLKTVRIELEGKSQWEHYAVAYCPNGTITVTPGGYSTVKLGMGRIILSPLRFEDAQKLLELVVDMEIWNPKPLRGGIPS